jgi:hypothetical protein
MQKIKFNYFFYNSNLQKTWVLNLIIKELSVNYSQDRTKQIEIVHKFSFVLWQRLVGHGWD